MPSGKNEAEAEQLAGEAVMKVTGARRILWQVAALNEHQY